MTNWPDAPDIDLISQPSARVVLDSISPSGRRVTTLEVVMHRFVLAEFNTHRAFSRNSASSRAVPYAKARERVVRDPAVPIAWPAEQRGMQGGGELPYADLLMIRHWRSARDSALIEADTLHNFGVHKSVVNRLLEPFMWHTVIVTATDWDGFWTQRCSPLAQPEIRAAAEAMRAAYDTSEPTRRKIGEWHTPYIQPDEYGDGTVEMRRVCRDQGWAIEPDVMRIQMSAARCARVSYLTHGGQRLVDADLALYAKLVSADPPHLSPLEHVCKPARRGITWHGNLTGWHQLRHLEPGKRDHD